MNHNHVLRSTPTIWVQVSFFHLSAPMKQTSEWLLSVNWWGFGCSFAVSASKLGKGIWKHWHVNIHTTVFVFYLQMLESQRKLEDWRKNIEETLQKLESKVTHHFFTSPNPSSSSTESPSDRRWKHFISGFPGFLSFISGFPGFLSLISGWIHNYTHM